MNNYLHARNATRAADLGQKVRVAASFSARIVGLLATSSLGEGEGLWLTPCSSIHTFFMRYPIDVLFLDKDGQVLKLNTYKPWTCSSMVSGSRGALELAAGTIERTRTQVGDRIELNDLPSGGQG